MVECAVWDREVAGSSPVTPTIGGALFFGVKHNLTKRGGLITVYMPEFGNKYSTGSNRFWVIGLELFDLMSNLGSTKFI